MADVVTVGFTVTCLGRVFVIVVHSIVTIYMSRDMMVHKAHKRLKMGISHFHNRRPRVPGF